MRQITTRIRRGMAIPAALLQALIDNDRTRSRKIASRPGLLTGIAPPHQFKVSVRKDGEAYYATVAPGYVRFKDPSSLAVPPIEDYMPEMDGTPLDETVDDEPPKLEVSSGDFIYCHFTTDHHGVIQDTPTIEASDSGETIHYQPDPDGVDGDYWLRIAQFTVDEEGVITITQYQQGGPIEFIPNLWSYEQVGGGREIIKERDFFEDKWMIRTLREKEDEPQIKLTEEDEYITVEGNGFELDLTNARKISLSVKDGLVVSGSYDDTEDGINAEVTIRDCNADPLADPPTLGTPLLTLTINEGKITHINGSDAGGSIDVTVQSCCWVDDPADDDWRS